jgi:hypothetical protein
VTGDFSRRAHSPMELVNIIRMAEPIVMKLCRDIMPLVAISAAYFVNPTLNINIRDSQIVLILFY